MFHLSDIFKIHLNRRMTQKVLDITDDELFYKQDLERKLILKCNNIEVHSILDCIPSIKNQFYLVVYPLDINLHKVSFYIFKKKYDDKTHTFLNTYGLCKKNFIIDFNLPVNNNKNWKEIHNKNIEWDDINISYLEEHNIKLEDYDNFISLYNDYKNIDFVVTNIWGESISEYNIDWQITLENILKKDFGIPRDDENLDTEIPYYAYFTKNTIQEIYYPHYNLNCYLYKYITKFSVFKCDLCNKFFGNNQKEKDIWHYSNFGDLCNYCYKKNKSDFFAKIDKIKKNILQQANKEMFQYELKKTIRFLNQKKIIELSLEKKNLIYKNVLRQMTIDRKGENCGICLDRLVDNIKAGKCGHCFHAVCINDIIGNKCPICRTQTEFFKLHI